MELYGRVRFAVRIEGLSERAVARRFEIDPRTVSKILKFSVPPGYRRTKPPVRPKLDAFVGIIDRILGDRSRPGSSGIRRSGSSSGFGMKTASRAASR